MPARTLSVRTSRRQAEEDSCQQFEALAEFANMGDRPLDWRKFRLKYPNFFPTQEHKITDPRRSNLTEWLYSYAEEWFKHSRQFEGTLPPLLWYRELLRTVWSGSDPTGAALYVLYGDEEKGRLFGLPVSAGVMRPFLSPGQFLDPEHHSSGLPPAETLINGATGEITWKFGCTLQQSVSDLMKFRWRAKLCPICGRHFVADKPAQSFCSTECSGESKRKRALDEWNRSGKTRREMRKKVGEKK
jgi:hypothetical protein